MSEEEQIKRIKKIRNISIIIIIIIDVMLIGLLIFMQSSSKRSVSSCTTMSSQEKELYNSKISKYIGNEKKGSDVKIMIEEIITNNNQYIGEREKFISIYSKNIKAYKNEEKLEKINKKANVNEDSNGENNQENIDIAAKEYRKLAQKISSGKDYKVEAEYSDGIIYKVIITQNNEENADKEGKEDE